MTILVAHQIAVRRISPKDAPLLEQMYNSYVPLEGTLGLPPRDSIRRKAWLRNLRGGVNFVAYVEGRLAGHLALLPTGGATEMVAYVHQNYRRQGVATAMTKAAIEEARSAGFAYIWLLVARDNIAAQRGLKKLRFRVAWQDPHEMQFLCPVTA
jgi:ribosomal protein S18 acetylase RimI-like enzyme